MYSFVIWYTYDSRTVLRIHTLEQGRVKVFVDLDDLALGPVEWTDHELRKELVWDWNMRLMLKLYVEE